MPPRDSSGHPLHSARLKHDYAVERLEELSSAMRAFLTGSRPRIRNEPHADRCGGDLYLEMTVEEAPEEWSLRIGDVVHQLRSSLDHVAWQLAPRRSKQTAFPRTKTEKQFREDGTKLGIDKTVLDRLERVRAQTALDPRMNPLWMLDELWNLDKHRLVPITVLAVRTSDAPPPVRNATLLSYELRSRSSSNGARIGSVRVSRDDFSAPWHADITFHYEVHFGTVTDAGGAQLVASGQRPVQVLTACAAAVGDVIGESQSAFQQQPFWDRIRQGVRVRYTYHLIAM